MKNLKAVFSHNTDDWKTPSDLYDYFVNQLRCVDCFPFQADYDEFERVYVWKDLFVNPPFSKLKFLPSWIKTQLDNGCTIYLLIPSRTDTKYFHEFLQFNPTIHFIKGRLRFNNALSAPFPTILLVFHPRYENAIRNYCVFGGNN